MNHMFKLSITTLIFLSAACFPTRFTGEDDTSDMPDETNQQNDDDENHQADVFQDDDNSSEADDKPPAEESNQEDHTLNDDDAYIDETESDNIDSLTRDERIDLLAERICAKNEACSILMGCPPFASPGCESSQRENLYLSPDQEIRSLLNTYHPAASCEVLFNPYSGLCTNETVQQLCPCEFPEMQYCDDGLTCTNLNSAIPDYAACIPNQYDSVDDFPGEDCSATNLCSERDMTCVTLDSERHIYRCMPACNIRANQPISIEYDGESYTDAVNEVCDVQTNVCGEYPSVADCINEQDQQSDFILGECPEQKEAYESGYIDFVRCLADEIDTCADFTVEDDESFPCEELLFSLLDICEA